MKVNGIEFSEIVDVYDNHGYDREVEVLGYDEAGNEYAAAGMESCGELVDIYEETILEINSDLYVPDEVWEPEYLGDR
jgi:hypothetical protein|tara:strand:+ start:317 stop:550 length:234 start_codon:yes stop_codon:yes gene_type:complete